MSVERDEDILPLQSYLSTEFGVKPFKVATFFCGVHIVQDWDVGTVTSDQSGLAKLYCNKFLNEKLTRPVSSPADKKVNLVPAQPGHNLSFSGSLE